MLETFREEGCRSRPYLFDEGTSVRWYGSMIMIEMIFLATVLGDSPEAHGKCGAHPQNLCNCDPQRLPGKSSRISPPLTRLSLLHTAFYGLLHWSTLREHMIPTREIETSHTVPAGADKIQEVFPASPLIIAPVHMESGGV